MYYAYSLGDLSGKLGFHCIRISREPFDTGILVLSYHIIFSQFWTNVFQQIRYLSLGSSERNLFCVVLVLSIKRLVIQYMDCLVCVY